MPKRPDIEVLTANTLKDGDVVFYTKDDQWSPQINEARLATSQDEADALLSLGEAAEKANKVVGVYLVGVVDIDGQIKADHIRERIRTLGPTIRLDLGKQAEGSAGNFPALDPSAQ